LECPGLSNTTGYISVAFRPALFLLLFFILAIVMSSVLRFSCTSLLSSTFFHLTPSLKLELIKTLHTCILPFWRSYSPFLFSIFHQEKCALKSSYILKGDERMCGRSTLICSFFFPQDLYLLSYLVWFCVKINLLFVFVCVYI
jgi:hypothetical protein